MAKIIKSVKGKIIAIILSILIAVSGAISVYYFIFKKEKDGGNPRVFNSEQFAAICRNRVQNAQYVPNINKFASDHVTTASTNNGYIKNADKIITVNNFNAVIEQIGDIDSPYDREFTIADVKEEVYKVLSNTSKFGEWICFYEGELQGYGTYFVDYNPETGHITIMRKSSFAPWVYDSANDRIVSNEDFEYDENNPNYPIEEDIIYKIEYYYNEQGVEVVECEIVNILNYYEDTIVGMYQYIKNVKNTSFTKYIIEPTVYLIGRNNDGSWGYDVDSKNPLGTARQFIQMDYTNPQDISLLFVRQEMSSAHGYGYDSTSFNFYRKLNDEIYLYNGIYAYGEYCSTTSSFVGSAPSVFSVYLNLNNYASGYGVGAPDMDYKNRSSENIEKYERELYYTNGSKEIAINHGPYYIKQASDDNECFYKLQSMPLVMNQTLSSLARSTKMSEEKIAQQLQISPEFLDVADDTCKAEYETFVDNYLTAITQNIVDTSYIKNNYASIRDAKIVTVYPNNTNAIKDYIKLTEFENESSIENSQLTYNASATIEPSILLAKQQNYQLALVAQGDGSNVIVLQQGEGVEYVGEAFVVSIAKTYDISTFKAYIEDNYIISVALVFVKDGKPFVCSESKALTFDSIPAVSIENGTKNNFEYSYQATEDNGNLKITTICLDKQAPTITTDLTITLSADSKIVDLLKKISIKDNGKIINITVSKDGNICYLFDAQVQDGVYTIVVTDFAGNRPEVNITVQIV